MMNVTQLAQALIRCPSVTPKTAGVFEVIEEFLVPLGFVAQRHTFHEEGFDPVENLYLRYGTSAPNFCFAGHTDVVPPGDEAAWSVPPFAAEIRNGELYGRGAEDMKGAIAAFMMAVREYLMSLRDGGGIKDAAHTPSLRSARGSASGLCGEPIDGSLQGSVSLLITQDEEGIAVNGTRKMLEWLKARGEVIDVCLVGEPTNPEILGEMVKIGRRGSISFTLSVRGRQGHVAYPERADNPIPRLVKMLDALTHTQMDNGTEYFPPSHLEVTSVDVGNPTVNVIPASASAKFNVRFNDLHTGHGVEQWVRGICGKFGAFELKHRLTGEAFHTDKHTRLADILVAAVLEVTGKTPVLSTTGGTSDARFIKDYCPVIEFGTTGRTAHMVDERVEIKTLEGLVAIYRKTLERFF
ncbi:MAG: succinyl-diaminopimelate desuccinylase [Alphaproteobacteria bacterium]